MPRFNTEHLRTFLEVVHAGGVRRAALGLNLTQPAVSARIKLLEEALGVPLFDRTAGGVSLTRQGRALIRYAEQLEHLHDDVTAHVAAPDAIDDQLRLGVAESVAQSWLPQFITALHAAFPRVEIEIDVDVSTNLRDRLLGREIDLAFLMGPVSEATVVNVPLPGFDLAWYCAPDAAGADGDLIGRLPVITFARNTRPHRELRRALLERVGPKVQVFCSSSLSACFRLIEAGLGVGALPQVLGRDLLAQGRVRSFDPGWTPARLQFSATYVGEGRSFVVASAAQLAQTTAQAYVDKI